MTGTYEHSLDSAGRLIVPSKLREELGSQFYLAVGVKENLTLYPMAAWNKLQERVANLTTAQAASMDVFFASAQLCEPDKQWRFQVPSYLKDYAKIDRDVVIIGSGDLSHKLKEDGPYGFQKEGPEYDERIMDVMGRGAFGELFDFSEDFCDKAAECGHRSFTIMAGALDGLKVKTERLSHQGTFGVGYGICIYEVTGSDPQRYFLEQYRRAQREAAERRKASEDSYVQLARKTVETYVRTGKKLRVPEGLPEEMYSRRAGVFVSLKEEGRLRGCIGTIAPVRGSIAEEIIENGISAAAKDPRFHAVEPEELDRLEYSVDVLGETEKIDSPEKLDVKRYGVVVSRGYRRGLLLPDLEGVDTVEEQIEIARRKAGIPEDAEDIRLERFEVVRHF